MIIIKWTQPATRIQPERSHEITCPNKVVASKLEKNLRERGAKNITRSDKK